MNTVLDVSHTVLAECRTVLKHNIKSTKLIRILFEVNLNSLKLYDLPLEFTSYVDIVFWYRIQNLVSITWSPCTEICEHTARTAYLWSGFVTFSND